MNFLAFDTSTRIGDVALIELEKGKDPSVIARAVERSGNHSRSIVGHIETVMNTGGLALSDLDAICVGAGPGSFTGLRIGLSTAKGLALGSGKPLFATSSLAAIAWQARNRPGLIAAIADARRKEVFVGYYTQRNGSLMEVAEEVVLPPSELAEKVSAVAKSIGAGDIHCIGEAVELYADHLSESFELISDVPQTPQAAAVAALATRRDHSAAASDLLTAHPVYIRPSEAEVKFPSGNPGGTFASFAAKRPPE